MATDPFPAAGAPTPGSSAPEPVLDLARLGPVRAVLQRFVDAEHLPGATYLVADGDAAAVDAVGQRWYGGPPMTVDSVFRIASLTKPIVGALAVALLEQGVVALDSAVERWLPELADRRVLRSPDATLDDTVPARRPITVEDLLTFRLGFGNAADPPGPHPIERAEAALELRSLTAPWPPTPHDVDGWIAALGSLPLMAQPGQRWLYNTGAQVLGVLLARATGVPLDRLLEDRLLGPLGMVDTAFSLRPGQADRFTVAYEASPGAAGRPAVLDGIERSSWAGPPSFPDASGGLLSTAGDLWRFARLLRSGGAPGGQRLLSEASVREMLRNRIPTEQRLAAAPFLSEATGWGYLVGVPAVAARGFEAAVGWMGGTGTLWSIDVEADRTAILLTQRALGSPDAMAVFDAFLQAVTEALDA